MPQHRPSTNNTSSGLFSGNQAEFQVIYHDKNTVLLETSLAMEANCWVEHSHRCFAETKNNTYNESVLEGYKNGHNTA